MTGKGESAGTGECRSKSRWGQSSPPVRRSKAPLWFPRLRLCRASLDRTGGSGCPHVVGAVFRALSALLVIVAAKDLPLRYQPILVLVPRSVSPLFVQLVCANADFLFQVRWGC